MQTNIIVKLQVEGFHSWPEAPSEVNFLSSPHRHIFHIICKKKVSHADRDIEIILFKRQIQRYLHRIYGDDFISTNPSVCNFHSSSCEHIAERLLEEFDLEYCSVLEDNENGAEIFKT